MNFNKLMAGLSLSIFCTVAFAAVTFNPETGAGFVGKGDVQLGFGWNNKQLQDNASQVGFTFQQIEQFSGTCSFSVETGGARNREVKTVTANRTKVVKVNGVVNSDPRTSPKQFTGFNLKGYVDGVTVVGSALEVGQPCEGGNVGDGQITEVFVTGYQASLNALYNGTSVKLNWPVSTI